MGLSTRRAVGPYVLVDEALARRYGDTAGGGSGDYVPVAFGDRAFAMKDSDVTTDKSGRWTRVIGSR